jgi:hypothetical protein
MVSYTDNFTGTDGDPIDGRSTTTGGGTWDVAAGSDGTATVRAGRLFWQHAATPSIGAAVLDLATGEQDVSIAVMAPGNSVNSGGFTMRSRQAAVFARFEDIDNFVYARVATREDVVDLGEFGTVSYFVDSIEVGKYVAGVRTVLVDYLPPSWPSTSTVRLLVQGNKIRAYHGSKLIAEVTDAAFQTETGVGVGHIRLASDTGATDRPSLDNFSATGLVTPPNTAVALSPVGGEYVDSTTGPVEFWYGFSSPVPFDYPTAWRLKAIWDATDHWLKADGTWALTEQSISVSSPGVDRTLDFLVADAGSIPDQKAVQHQLQWRNSQDQWALAYSPLALFNTAQTPALLISEPDEDDVIDSTTTLVTYGQIGGTGYTLTRHRARVYLASVADEVGFDPDASTSLVDTGWVNASAQEILVSGLPVAGDLAIVVVADFSDAPMSLPATRHVTMAVAPASPPILFVTYSDERQSNIITLRSTANLLSKETAKPSEASVGDWVAHENAEVAGQDEPSTDVGEGVLEIKAVENGISVARVSEPIPLEEGEAVQLTASMKYANEIARDVEIGVLVRDLNGAVIAEQWVGSSREVSQDQTIQFRLLFSNLADLSDAQELNGTVNVSGTLFLFLEPAAYAEVVEILIDGVSLDTVTEAPFLTHWASTDVADGLHVVSAVVSTVDGKQKTLSAYVNVENVIETNDPPVAVMTPSRSVIVGETIVVSMAGSSDPDNDPLTYSFLVTAQPSGSAVSPANRPNAWEKSFTFTHAGAYEIRGTVTDDGGASRGLADPEPLFKSVTSQFVAVGSTPGASTADPNATPATKAHLAKMLSMRAFAKAGNRVGVVAVGQHTTEDTLAGTNGSSPATMAPNYVDSTLVTGGKHLGYRSYGLGQSVSPRVIADMKAQYDRGGLIGATFIPPNPEYDNLPPITFSSNSNYNADTNQRCNLVATITPGTRQYDNLIRSIDLYIDRVLLPIQNAGIHGLQLRFMPESNLAGYWYTMNPYGFGSRHESGDTTYPTRNGSTGALTGGTIRTFWRYDRFHVLWNIWITRFQERGVHNLLYVYSPGLFAGNIDAAVGSFVDSAPPSNQWDLWASSRYNPESSGFSGQLSQMRALYALYPNKVFGGNETGRAQSNPSQNMDLTTFLDHIKLDAETTVWEFWHNGHEIIRHNRNGGNKKMVNDPVVLKAEDSGL